MTPHPTDTEALQDRMRRAVATAEEDGCGAYINPRDLTTLLDALAAAEHRATRAEAQSAVRGRAVAIYQARASEAEAELEAARGYISELETAIQSRNEVIKHRDTRIKAVQDVADGHRQPTDRIGDLHGAIRRALDGGT